MQLCVFSPTGFTQPPLSHLTAVPRPLLCRAVLRAGKATPVTKQTLKCLPYPSARAHLRGISFWDFQSQFLPSATALPHSLDSPQHCYWRGLCKYMQPRAHFGINQSKLKLMNKKQRNRSSNKAISLSFPLCLSFFFKKAGFFSLCFFWRGRSRTVFNFFKQSQQTETVAIQKNLSSNARSCSRNNSWHFSFSLKCCFQIHPYYPFWKALSSSLTLILFIFNHTL